MTNQRNDNWVDTEEIIFNFDNSFARELAGLFVACNAEKVPEPALLIFNQPLAEELCLDSSKLETPFGAEIFAGNRPPDGACLIAQVYAGHQFGNFSPQLGDGRAILLGEIIDKAGIRQDVQLKGSGQTPFSRRGDGKAALGPVLREYLISEAMYALGVPTTFTGCCFDGRKSLSGNPTAWGCFNEGCYKSSEGGDFRVFAARGDSTKFVDWQIMR